MKKSDLNVATQNEIIFIQRLGTGEWSAVGAKMGRSACLRGYLRGALVRSNWGKIARDVAIKTATSLLLKLH